MKCNHLLMLLTICMIMSSNLLAITLNKNSQQSCQTEQINKAKEQLCEQATSTPQEHCKQTDTKTIDFAFDDELDKELEEELNEAMQFTFQEKMDLAYEWMKMKLANTSSSVSQHVSENQRLYKSLTIGLITILVAWEIIGEKQSDKKKIA